MALSSSDEEVVVTLVEQAKAGNNLAFEKLFLLYSDAIYRHLRYMVGDDEVARDLTQDCFLKAWENLRTLHHADRFKYWLYRIAENKALNYIRHDKLVSWFHHEDGDTLTHSNRQGSGENPNEKWILLRLALERVRPKYRQCLILQEIDGFSQDEIAQIIGIKKSSVSQYVKRGYEELNQAYRSLNNVEKIFLGREYSL